MFREVKRAEIKPENFGVGSIIKAGNSVLPHLVIKVGDNTVTLVNMVTYRRIDKVIEVQDPAHMTYEEVKGFLETLQPQFTASDFEFDAQGVKRIKL